MHSKEYIGWEIGARARMRELKKEKKRIIIKGVPQEIVDAFHKYKYFVYFTSEGAAFRNQKHPKNRFRYSPAVETSTYSRGWRVEHQTSHYYPMVGRLWDTDNTDLDLPSLVKTLERLDVEI